MEPSKEWRNEARKQLIGYWEKYHTDYVSLIARYHDLIKEKEKLGLVKHAAKDGAFLRAYPDIPFLAISRKDRVVYKLNKMSPAQIRDLLYVIERYVVRKGSEFDNVRGLVRFHEGDLRDQKRPKKYVLERGLGRL